MIYSAFSGTVTSVNNSCGHVHYGAECAHYSTYGNSIYVKSDDGKIHAIYGHLKQNSILVKSGDKVEKGQPLASMGSSGYSTGKHLHFEVRKSNSSGGMGSSSATINVNPISSGTNPGVVAYSSNGYKSPKSDVILEGTYSFNNEIIRLNWSRLIHILDATHYRKCAGHN